MRANQTDIAGIKKILPAGEKELSAMILTMYVAYYLPAHLRKSYAVIHRSIVDPLVKELASSKPEELGFSKKKG